MHDVVYPNDCVGQLGVAVSLAVEGGKDFCRSRLFLARLVSIKANLVDALNFFAIVKGRVRNPVTPGSSSSLVGVLTLLHQDRFLCNFCVFKYFCSIQFCR